MSDNLRDLIQQSKNDVKQMLSEGLSRAKILSHLTVVAEALAGSGSTASILILDDEGLLRNGASPNLPADYLAAIDRLKPDANLGTCASAAATGSVVMTPDFYADDKWAELRHLPLGLGYVAAWSVPIKDQNGTVLGTFGTYFRDRRYPSQEEQDGLKILAQAAAIAIQN